MDYQSILEQLHEAGWNHYRIRKETGISYYTLRRIRDGITKSPRISTHNDLVRLYNREVIKDV